ncbi:MAG: hypothetical protein ACXVXO_12065 [Mycobacteriaceae bacterium]
MKLRSLSAAVVLAILSLSAAATPAVAQTPSGSDDGSAAYFLTYTVSVVSTDLVTGEVVSYDSGELTAPVFDLPGLASDPLGAKCSPGGRALTGTLSAYDGNNLVFKFHHDIDFYYNCTNVTRMTNQAAYFSNMNGGWQDKGTSKSAAGAGTPHATALGQGDAARYCTFWGCVNHQHPAIKWSLTGTGHYSATAG